MTMMVTTLVLALLAAVFQEVRTLITVVKDRDNTAESGNIVRFVIIVLHCATSKDTLSMGGFTHPTRECLNSTTVSHRLLRSGVGRSGRWLDGG